METAELLKKVRKIEIKTKKLTNNLFTGQYHSAFKGKGMVFSEVRKYVPGDDVRDIDWNVTAKLSEPYIKVFEDEIRKEQLGKITNSQELLNLSKEYDKKKSLEAKVVKDADLLDQVLLLREYEWGGNKEAKRWLDGGFQEKKMYNQITRQIVKEVSKQRPSLWWDNLWTGDRR